MKREFSLRIGKPISIDYIAVEAGLSLDETKSLVSSEIKKHYSSYGNEPFSIEYSRNSDGYILRARSSVGKLDCGVFYITIHPKFENLDLGKCLQLAHYSQSYNLVQHNNQICEELVSEEDVLQGIDYFALSFVSTVQDCINDGLIQVFSASEKTDPELKGKLVVAKHVNNGGNPLEPITQINSRSINCHVNQILKAALLRCIDKCEHNHIRTLASGLLISFKDCGDPVDTDFLEMKSSIPRPDYDRALALAEVILNGFSSSEGDAESFAPCFTMDLDKIFEGYCSYEIRKILTEAKFEVISQDKKNHRFSPSLVCKNISPDIVVRCLEPSGRTVILDSKNKFSLLSDSETSISNSDIFQIYYYAKSYGSNVGILIYPGSSANYTRFPIKSAEGAAAYLKKQSQRINQMMQSGNDIFKLDIGESQDFYLVLWRLNLSGSLHETRKSVAELCMFIDYVCSNNNAL
jgi:5-methylcytosine-specific restriction enzyme subunit McrC